MEEDNDKTPVIAGSSPYLGTSQIDLLNQTPSPSEPAFIQTSATLDGLAKQLGDLSDDDDVEVRCCCGQVTTGGCPTLLAREKGEAKLKMSGEIGNALLARYEALEKKYQRSVEKYEYQLEIKKQALADSIKRVHNLERANTTHLQKYAEISKKNEALDKRYTQAMHTQTLTQQSLTHVRSEVTKLRAAMTRQSLALASGTGVEDRLEEIERRCQEAMDLADAEGRKAKDDMRKRKRAEARIEELEGQLALKAREVEEVRDARSKDANDLLSNAKERLALLHAELSESFRAGQPEEMPEYQRTLETLVADNTLLKHDALELSLMATELREENQTLRDEVDDLRSAVGVVRRASPDPTSQRASHHHLASEISRSHTRVGSSPMLSGFVDRNQWARASIQIPKSSRILLEHGQTPSMARHGALSVPGLEASPGLGVGPVGEYGGQTLREEGSPSGMTPPMSDGRNSPKAVLKASPSGGIGYVFNGVPKGRYSSNLSRSSSRPVSLNLDRNRLRAISPNRDVIAEWGPVGGDGQATSASMLDEATSPGASEYFRAAEMARKRRSMLSRADTNSPRDSAEMSPNASTTLVDQSISEEISSPMSDGAIMTPGNEKRVHRRPLLLLTRSRGVQTDPTDQARETRHREADSVDSSQDNSWEAIKSHAASSSMASHSSPRPSVTKSETSSLHGSNGILAILIEYLLKALSRIQSTDVKVLNQRLRRQHLAGDVKHISRSTLQVLLMEFADLRLAFRGVHEITSMDRKEMIALLKLFKEIFTEMIELRAVVNDLTVEPSLAKKLHKEAFAEEEDATKQASGLGWIAAPIAKLFVTPGDDAARPTSPRPGKIMDSTHLQPNAARGVPKIQALASATTTHVSVEFGGAGMVKKATPGGFKPARSVSTGTDGLPASPIPAVSDSSGLGNRVASMPVRSSDIDVSQGRTLQHSQSKAGRNELLGIFAGAGPRPLSPNGWIVLPEEAGTSDHPGPAAGKAIRKASSKHLKDRSRPARPDPTVSRKLPANVDAVIDSTRADVAESGAPGETVVDAPLLERTLRPRGLSDSSIRSTFVSHADSFSAAPATRAVAYPITTEDKKGYGYLGNLANRFYPFRAASSSFSTEGETVLSVTPNSLDISSPPASLRTDDSSIKDSVKRNATGLDGKAKSPNTFSTASTGDQTGFLGYLASGLAVNTEGYLDSPEHHQDRYRGGFVSPSTRIGPRVGSRLSGEAGWR